MRADVLSEWLLGLVAGGARRGHEVPAGFRNRMTPRFSTRTGTSRNPHLGFSPHGRVRGPELHVLQFRASFRAAFAPQGVQGGMTARESTRVRGRGRRALWPAPLRPGGATHVELMPPRGSRGKLMSKSEKLNRSAPKQGAGRFSVTRPVDLAHRAGVEVDGLEGVTVGIDEGPVVEPAEVDRVARRRAA